MKYKITVELELGVSGVQGAYNQDGFTDVKKMLMLAQAGLIQKYADRLISAGSMQNGGFYPAYQACTYVELRDEEKKEV